jgi:acyl-CoA reductase-like NAD-dependent aldehyde dehydrogenase
MATKETVAQRQTGVDYLGEAARAFVTAPQRMLVGGEWVEAADGATFSTEDPAFGVTIADVPKAGKADADAAVKAARKAFDEGPWATAPAAERQRLMLALADLIEENADELAELESLDNGKPVKVARLGDVSLAAAHFRYYAGWPTKIEGETIPVARPDMLCYTRKEPVAVCAQIIPWNYPLLMAAWKLSPALAAGCAVVLKPAEQTPLTALRLGQLACEAGFPDGVVNVVTGDGTTGAALVDHPGVDKIAFTGSTAVGREIGAKAGQGLKRVTLELGGKSPQIVLPDAPLELVAGGAFQAIYSNTGQACNAGSRLFAPRDRFDEIISALAESAAKTTLGPGLDTSSRMGPLISEEQLDRVMGYIESGREEGAEVVTGGSAHPEGPPGNGYYVEPTIFTGVDDGMRIAREEIFGPVLAAMPYDDLDEVAARANDTEYGLAAGVWTGDLAAAHRLAAKLKAGSVYINTWGDSDAAAPFGGFKASGIGREMGHANLDAYLELKTVWANIKA